MELNMQIKNVHRSGIMTLSNGNKFLATVPFSGNSLCCQYKLVEQTLHWPIIRDAMTIILRRSNVHTYLIWMQTLRIVLRVQCFGYAVHGLEKTLEPCRILPVLFSTMTIIIRIWKLILFRQHALWLSHRYICYPLHWNDSSNPRLPLSSWKAIFGDLSTSSCLRL